MKNTETTYVALLRGINVGGNNKIEMKALKKCFEDLHFKNISTYINSGNVIFSTSSLDKTTITDEVEAAIAKQFKLNIPVVLRTKAEIQQLCQKLPATWTNDKTIRTDVLFLWDSVDTKRSLTEIQINPTVDHLLYIKGAIIWNIDRANYTKSKMNKFIGTHIYKNMTARNVNTTRKLHELLSL